MLQFVDSSSECGAQHVCVTASAEGTSGDGGMECYLCRDGGDFLVYI